MIPPCNDVPCSYHELSYSMMSKFQHLLTTNDIPTDTEVQDAKAYCSDPELRATAIKKRFEEMHRERKILAKELSELEEKYALQAHRSIASPLRRLPTELLQDIFLMSAPNHCIMRTKEPPLVYGRVCSRWRSVSLATPELWSNLHLVIPRPIPSPQANTQTIARLANGIDQWMGRTAGTPLDIHIVCRERRIEDSEYALDIFIKFIIAYSRRLKNLTLDIPSFLMDHFCRFETAEGFPMLQSIQVSISDYHYPSGNPTTTPMLRTAPCLRRVSFSCFCPDLNTELPLSQITHINIDLCDNWCANTLQIILVLAQCPLLAVCNIRTSDTPSEDFEHTSFEQPIVLPSLRILVISALTLRPVGNSEILTLPDFLDNINAPALVHLKVDGHRAISIGFPHDEPYLSLSNFLSRSSSPLESLKLGSGLPRPNRDTTIADCLRYTPHLKKLVIRDSSYPWNHSYSPAGHPKVASAMLALLTVDTGEAALAVCPQLETIKLDDAFGFEEDELVRMLKSRSEAQLGADAGVAPLKKVKLNTYRPLEVADSLSFVQLNIERMYDSAKDAGRDWSDDWRIPWNFVYTAMGLDEL